MHSGAYEQLLCSSSVRHWQLTVACSLMYLVVGLEGVSEGGCEVLPPPPPLLLVVLDCCQVCESSPSLV